MEPGTVVGDDNSRYRLDAIEAQNDVAVIFRATPLQPIWYGHHPDVQVSSTVFVVMLRQPLIEELAEESDRWKAVEKQMRKAMVMVDPTAAGFPNWKRIRQDDMVMLFQDEADGCHRGVFQLSSYRRWMAKLASDNRRPKNFSTRTRRLLLEAASNQCQRCGAKDKLEVDHVVPVAFGGTNDLTNGFILCSTCHLAKSRAERKAFGLSLDAPHSKGTFPLRGEKELFSDYLDRYLEKLAVLSGWNLGLSDRDRPNSASGAP